MNKFLIFLESTTKKNTIRSFVGKEYEIFATGGHLRDLKKTGLYNLGVDLINFTPNYEIIATKTKLISFWKNYLRREKIDIIYLATDPDREGEAIAAEITQILNISPARQRRLFFYEITPRSVKEALTNPLTINENLVEAQNARQVLDRMIGFCLSSLLQKKINALSAGRVQSVALKLIVERELLIRSHEKKKEYIICITSQVGEEKITLRQVNSEGKLVIYPDPAEAEKVKEKLGLDLQLVKKQEEEKFIFPKFPLTTSLLLFEARSWLGFSIAKTTQLSQKLYEGVNLVEQRKQIGLITYPRTDSTRVSQEFTSQAYNFISQEWGKNYCNFHPTWKKKEKKLNIQDAHESIHPTYLNYHPTSEEVKKSLTSEEQQLYGLIFRHSLTSFMAPAQIKKIIYTFINNNYYFATTERVNQFFGFLAYNPTLYLPHYRVKIQAKLATISYLPVQEIEIQEYLENKPVRYNEGSLVQELERLGIGRPSTYNAFGHIIRKRKYVELNQKGHFVPTELGFTVNQWLQENFSHLINENYTAYLETELDKISQNQNTYLNFIKSFWEEFIQHFQKIRLS
jgi:DNA topoisomerase-1